MPITNITHNAYYTVEMGGDLTRITLDNIHTAYKHICLQGTGCVCVKNYPPEMMQSSSSTRATIVSAENQSGATIVKATIFFCHYYIAWESNNAGEARGQSWDESLKSRWIPGGSCGYTSGTKRKHFAALSSPRPCWRWLQLQPSCGSPQCCWKVNVNVIFPGDITDSIISVISVWHVGSMLIQHGEYRNAIVQLYVKDNVVGKITF